MVHAKDFSSRQAGLQEALADAMGPGRKASLRCYGSSGGLVMQEIDKKGMPICTGNQKKAVARWYKRQHTSSQCQNLMGCAEQRVQRAWRPKHEKEQRAGPNAG